MSYTSVAQQAMLVGSARIDLQNVQLREGIVLDELHLEGGNLRVELPSGECETRVTGDETKIRAIMSETNLNRLVDSSLPQDAPVRSVHIGLLSGRARISGKVLVSIVPFPFSIEAIPRIENGVRVILDCRTATLGVDLPRAVVDILEQRLNEALSLDVSALEIPIWVDEIRCEPGRLTATGRARIDWPPRQALLTAPTPSGRRASSGFTNSDRPLFGEPEPAARKALSAGPEGASAEDPAEPRDPV